MNRWMALMQIAAGMASLGVGGLIMFTSSDPALVLDNFNIGAMITLLGVLLLGATLAP